MYFVTPEDFRRSLLDAGLLVDGGVPGLYLRSFDYENIITGITRHVSAAGSDEKFVQLYAPPVIARSTIERTGYLSSFPDLIGLVSIFDGTEFDHMKMLERLDSGEEWGQSLTPSDVALSSAACHCVYPLLAEQTMPVGGLRYEIQGYCFRHEPSGDPARMQSFRQHEFVYIGTIEGAVDHRDRWQAKAVQLLQELGLHIDVVPANDPFFGRGGQILAADQLEKVLKHELVTPISSDQLGAISSSNYHEDHFGATFSISSPEGGVAHSACFAFGLERIALSLIRRHGPNLVDWPTNVRELLGV
jgi:seryl-tRNA synthetase